MNLKETLKHHPIMLSLAQGGIGLYRDMRTRIHNRRLVRQRSSLIRSYLATHPVRKLQLGAGPAALEGWLNTDVRPRRETDAFLDAGEPFPFDDATFDYVFSEHLIQHLPYPVAKSMLQECCRVLKPAGCIRVAAPNLWSFVCLCGKGCTERYQGQIRWYLDHLIETSDGYAGGFVINGFLKEEAFLFDPETLRLAIQKAGFVDVTECAVCESDHEHLRGLESHGRVIDNEDLNRFETFVMEARRPLANSSAECRKGIGVSA
jgi:SAM-dependent methyltransferase